MSRDFGWNDGYYTPAPPIAVSGGIKAANARGASALGCSGAGATRDRGR